MFVIVIRQCTPSLRSTIKGDTEYEKKSSDFDTLWLLRKTKKTAAGVDMKANKALTLHGQIIIFLNTNQGQTESDDDYLSRFDSRIENMNLAGGTHVLCTPQIIGKYLSQCNTAEINANKERFKEMSFVLRAYESRYEYLL